QIAAYSARPTASNGQIASQFVGTPSGSHIGSAENGSETQVASASAAIMPVNAGRTSRRVSVAIQRASFAISQRTPAATGSQMTAQPNSAGPSATAANVSPRLPPPHSAKRTVNAHVTQARNAASSFANRFGNASTMPICMIIAIAAVSVALSV